MNISPLFPRQTEKIAFFLAITGLLFLACNGKKGETPLSSTKEIQMDTTNAVVLAVNRCARLYTTEYKIRKIVTFSDNPHIEGNILGLPVRLKTRIGDRKVALPVDVTLKAYIDLERFGPTNVNRTDSTLVLTLPDPVIIATASKVDNEGTRQFVDPLRSAFTDEELTALSRQGLDTILNHTGRYGIVKQARDHATATLVPLLRRMGYRDDKVVIRFGRTDFSDEDLRRMTIIKD